MTQDDIDVALETITPPPTRTRAITKCDVARMVYDFLSVLIDRANFLQRQVLRTVRGYVRKYMDGAGCG
jgi:hypothetical protein